MSNTVHLVGGFDVASHARLMVESYARWTGRELLRTHGVGVDLVTSLIEAPFVLVSHGVESDPILNFGNRRALELWELSWEELTRMPSRLTAEAPSREERAALLDRVTRFGFIDNYSGVRISKTGRRFRIEQAVVWNLIDANGVYRGQAATFDRWIPCE